LPSVFCQACDILQVCGHQLPIRRIRIRLPIRSHRRVRVIIHVLPDSFSNLIESFVTPSVVHDKHSISCRWRSAATPKCGANHSRIPPRDTDRRAEIAPGPIAGGGGRDDRIADALDVELRPGEAGERAFDMEANGIGGHDSALGF